MAQSPSSEFTLLDCLAGKVPRQTKTLLSGRPLQGRGVTSMQLRKKDQTSLGIKLLVHFIVTKSWVALF